MSSRDSKIKFDKQMYDENDPLAKGLFISYIKEKGHEILHSEEDYNHDIITKKDRVVFYFELEMKIGYPFTDRDSFRFPTVSFLGRKERLHNMKPFFYVIICKETGWAISCPSTKIYKEEYIERRYAKLPKQREVDKFYRVPKEHCTFFQIKKED